ncbi:hypothetical protein HDV00_001237 [Rhizophlyctis rosea]|nr:hypothetical protein HDV00_001237 [Rhizophlyctis rosea]
MNNNKVREEYVLTLNVVNSEVYAQRLGDPNVGVNVKLEIISEIRDSMDTLQHTEYARILGILIPCFNRILIEEPPSFASNSMEQKLRSTILDIIHRFPSNEYLKTFASDLIKTILHIFRVDNEENAITALKIMVELHRQYKQYLEDDVKPFFDIVQEMYQNMDQAVKDTFDEIASTPTPSGAQVPASPAAEGNEPTSARDLPKAMFSFKVLTECPIIIALLFQLHRKFVSEAVSKFVPLIINILKLEPRAQEIALQELDAAGKGYVGMSPAIKNKAAYGDFIALQVKTASFIAYILKSFVMLLKEHAQVIADALINLMRACPADAAASRKELLVATRAILYTDFRSAFIKHLDLLLDEDVVVGPGITQRDALRATAHTMLVDFLHHVRHHFAPQQLARIVHIYSQLFNDTGFPLSVQTVMGRLLTNLYDAIDKLPDKAEARKLLLCICNAIATKLHCLHVTLPIAMKYQQKRRNLNPMSALLDQYSSTPDFDGFVDLGYVQPIRTAAKAFENSLDVLKDARALIKNMLVGMIKTFNSIRHTGPIPSIPDVNDPRQIMLKSFKHEEADVLVRYLREGLACASYYNAKVEGQPHRMAPPTKEIAQEEKDICEALAQSLMCLDPATFQDIFSSHIPYIFEQMVLHPGVIALPQALLSNPLIVSNVAGLLLRFLVERLTKLGEKDQNYAATMLRLFKVLFVAVTQHPDKLEMVLRPHLGNIIMTSMKNSGKAVEPMNYFMLLRSLFRSIGGGRFELLYQEVLPFLQVLLESLNGLLAAAHKPHMRELFVELCLTVPVRLSVLLPYLSQLMKPLVYALQASQELVSQGLRTLELCIDNLTQEFLEPIMAPVIKDLMMGLWKHLRPSANTAKTGNNVIAMRILGKLGGRNRKFLKDPIGLDFQENHEFGVELGLVFQSYDRAQWLSLDKALDLVARILESPNNSPFYREQAFMVAKCCLPLLLDVDEGGEGFLEQFREIVQYYLASTAADTKSAMTVAPMEGVEQQGNATAPDPAQPLQPSQTIPERSPFIDPPSVSREKKEAIDKALCRVIVTLFNTCAGGGPLEGQAWELMESLCRHVAILCINDAVDEKCNPTSPAPRPAAPPGPITQEGQFRVDGFMQAVVEVMASEDQNRRSLAEKSILLIHSNCMTFLGSKEAQEELPFLHVMASRFSACCYQEVWFRKTGGVAGINLLTAKLELGTKWMLQHELEFVKAILYVLKDTSAEFVAHNMDEASSTLSFVLRGCHRAEDGADVEERTAKFNSLISLLISELSNSSSVVRETIQSSLQLLADLSNKEVTEILTPVQDRLLSPIFAKPLRALPFPMQIGNIDAITYCLSLRPPLLTFNDELMRLLQEALALADAEDQALVNKSSQYKNATSLINLRTVCIRLLSSAMQCNDFTNPRLSQLRARIISVFFKSLYSKSSEIVEVANKGLSQVLTTHNKLPKDLLQAGLRPILVNLSDFKKLTVAGLEGLARLLELLTNYFKVEIGKKLLDHLRMWADQKMLADSAGKALSDVEDIKIIVAILDVFHLLPPTANIFMDELVREVLKLEDALGRAASSPFRAPLIKFLNRYATDSVKFFLDNLHQPPYALLYIDILNSEQASVVRIEAVSKIDQLVEKTFSVGMDQSGARDLYAFGARILVNLINWGSDWILQQRPLMDTLCKIWQWRRGTSGVYDPAVILPGRESEQFLHILITYCKRDPNEVKLIFSMIEGFRQQDLVDKSFLKQFYFDEVAERFTGAQKRAILLHFLSLFSDTEVSAETKTWTMRMLITPMLLVSFSRGENLDIIDGNIMQLIHGAMWAPFMVESAAGPIFEETLKLEVIQFTTLLLQYIPGVTDTFRKDIIKFAWGQLKVEDACKQPLYVLLARFVEQYETPQKIITQIYVPLLKTHQPENKLLVRQAIDILLPVLPKRLTQPMADAKAVIMPAWARWARKVIIDEFHSVSQLLPSFLTVIRHGDLFYECRDHFIPQIVQSMSKIGLSGNATADRLVSLDLCELIIGWEKRLLDERKEKGGDSANVDQENESVGEKRKGAPSGSETPPAKRRASDAERTDTPTPGPESTGELRGFVPSHLREIMIHFLGRFICTLNDSGKRGMAFRTINIMRNLLTLWPEVDVKLQCMEKAINMEIKDETKNVVCNAIEMVTTVLELKSSSWIVSNMKQIHTCVEKWIKTDNIDVMRALSPLLSRVYKAIPDVQLTEGEPAAAEVADFVKAVDAVINNGIKEKTVLYPTISLLNAACLHRPDALQNYLSELMPLLQRLQTDEKGRADRARETEKQKERDKRPGSVPNLGGNTASSPAVQSADKEKELVPNMIIMLLQVLRLRVSQMGDQRKAFLQCLSGLIDSHTDPEVLRYILTMVGDWLQLKNEPFPTLKEKANLLLKLLCVEHCGDKGLLEEYLNLIGNIYTDPSFLQTDLTVRLENAFLLGTKNENPAIRTRFAEIFDSSIARSLVVRLNYIFGLQNWDFLGNFFWLNQALDLILGSAMVNDQVHSCAPTLRVHAITSVQLPDLTGDGDVVMESEESLVVPDFTPAMEAHRDFLRNLQGIQLSSLLTPLRNLLYFDTNLTYSLWVAILPMCWNLLNGRERHDLVKIIIPLLAQPYHQKQMEHRPNVIQALLDGFCKCLPPIQLPPQLVKYLGKSYNAWHNALELLQNAAADFKPAGSVITKDEENVRESIMDAIADLFDDIAEEDYYFGHWRRRCLFAETNAALSYEQGGLWAQAQLYYESAQSKARSGLLPFTEAEYSLWENHWVSCAQRLQQWDILTDLAKFEQDHELLMECAWRLSDFNNEREGLQNTLNSLSPQSNRKKTFEAFMLLLQIQESPEKAGEFEALCHESIQITLKKWIALPEKVTQAHVPLLHAFQQIVEFGEAEQIQNNLRGTNSLNIDGKAQELKGILQTWRERLPNNWDDINLWSDLVHWRQHVFSTINKAYLPLIPQLNQTAATPNPSSSYAYRGYHETAWIINRFARVSRKHQLTDVCISSLGKIYTLPNIEIQEAFFKLREQAKCHFQSPAEYHTGLDVINNTNLLYFSTQQKAEFFALKGIFLAKLNLHGDAQTAFSSAIQMDPNLAKGWAAWGQYCDRMYKENPSEIKHAAEAINCYLQAAGIYNRAKSRKYLARILWLLTLDDEQGTLASTFQNTKVETPLWHWIFFIPQLLSGLAAREPQPHFNILSKLAKSYPQAMHFQLRTAKEDFIMLKKAQASGAPPATTAARAPDGQNGPNAPGAASNGPTDNGVPAQPALDAAGNPQPIPTRKQPWELVELVMGTLKTAFPLLALSMEAMGDQILQRLKPTTDEDIYRLIVALLNDGVQQIARDPRDHGALSQATEMNLQRFAESMQPNHLKYKAAFERDFIKSKPNLSQLVDRFRDWRDKLEVLLDNRPRRLHLETFSHYLVEFEFSKFEEIEVPGQYFLYVTNGPNGQQRFEIANMKTELLEEIGAKLVPDTILTKYMLRTLQSYADLWIMRKQFTQSMAAATFMTYVLSIGGRQPHKFHISRATGNVWLSDLLPSLNNSTFQYTNTEAVPFRLTPNIQQFITPAGVEGVFTSALMSIGHSLTEPEFELDDYLSIFIRDELVTWQNISRKAPVPETQLRDFVSQNVELVMKRAQALSCKAEREKANEKVEPVCQTMLDLISNAVNPSKLAAMDVQFMASL